MAAHSDTPEYTATCCASTSGEPHFSLFTVLRQSMTYDEQGCALYVDCDVETAPPDAQDPIPNSDLPHGWSVAVPCAVDNPNRVLANVIVSYAPSTTPYECTTLCQSKGYQYAGVEYGDECYCGTGYAGGVAPPTANNSDCDMTCAGSYYYTCGGSWRMEIFSTVS